MFKFTCSVVLRGGRGTADKCNWLVWGTLAVFRPHWVCPSSGRVCVLSPVYTAQTPGCSPGSGPCVACTSQAQAAQIQVFGYSTKAETWLGLRFVPSPVGAAQTARSLTHTLSPSAGRLITSAVPASVYLHTGRVHLVSVLGSWTLAATLLVDVDRPKSQGSLWLEAGSLFAVW